MLILVLVLALLAQTAALPHALSSAMQSPWPSRFGHVEMSGFGRLYVMGGVVKIGTEWALAEDVWSTLNPANGPWVSEPAVPWVARESFAGAYCQEGNLAGMWVAGGRSMGGLLGDLWHQPRYGSAWQNISREGTSWSARMGHQVGCFNQTLWLLGGYTGSGGSRELWRTTTGTHWRLTTPVGLPALTDFSMSLFQHKVWLVQGCERSCMWRSFAPSPTCLKNCTGRLWYSTGGEEWHTPAHSHQPMARVGTLLFGTPEGLWLLGQPKGGAYQPWGMASSLWHSHDGVGWNEHRQMKQQLFAGGAVYKNRVWISAGLECPQGVCETPDDMAQAWATNLVRLAPTSMASSGQSSTGVSWMANHSWVVYMIIAVSAVLCTSGVAGVWWACRRFRSVQPYLEGQHRPVETRSRSGSEMPEGKLETVNLLYAIGNADLLIPWESIDMGDRFAAGSSGQVYHGRFCSEHVVLKECYAEMIGGDLDEFEREAAILHKLNHPRIVRFYGVTISSRSSQCFIVTEFCRGGNLEANVELHGGFHGSEVRVEQFWQYAVQIADAMAFCHSKRTMHRDLKPANILIAHDESLKVCDLGLALLYEELLPLRELPWQGTPAYTPPEVLNNPGRPRSSGHESPRRSMSPSSFHEAAAWDVYSYAVLLCFMWSGEHPYDDMPPSQVVNYVIGGGRPRIEEENMRSSHWFPQPLADLIRKMWCDEPMSRPSFAEVCELLMESEMREQLVLGARGTSSSTDASFHSTSSRGVWAPSLRSSSQRSCEVAGGCDGEM
eukprot:TRINITY_DN7352_c0_g1_i1.p1 TRINITY_DN7352_c0_g1~~TRINITY_DN7352_c0_g1_i1.p1  ORF type:complete len:778 (+),score=106.26 TRINITY_DN7352_c0_g1_i1:2-2335(+)